MALNQNYVDYLHGSFFLFIRKMFMIVGLESRIYLL